MLAIIMSCSLLACFKSGWIGKAIFFSRAFALISLMLIAALPRIVGKQTHSSQTVHKYFYFAITSCSFTCNGDM